MKQIKKQQMKTFLLHKDTICAHTMFTCTYQKKTLEHKIWKMWKAFYWNFMRYTHPYRHTLILADEFIMQTNKFFVRIYSHECKSGCSKRTIKSCAYGVLCAWYAWAKGIIYWKFRLFKIYAHTHMHTLRPKEMTEMIDNRENRFILMYKWNEK